jgi:hypothetical protein
MPHRLIGTWTLVGVEREEVGTGRKDSFLGDNPSGYLTYSDGRMLAIITRGERKPPAKWPPTPEEANALMRSLIAYGGNYAVESAGTVVHDVDISWNQTFTGGRQVRKYTFDGDDCLTLETPASPDPVDGVVSVRRLTWKRVKKA